jgi:hypothetical protein
VIQKGAGAYLQREILSVHLSPCTQLAFGDGVLQARILTEGVYGLGELIIFRGAILADANGEGKISIEDYANPIRVW